MNKVIAIALLFTLVGCQATSTQEPVVIGVASAHTGPTTSITAASNNAVQLAAEDWQKNHNTKAQVIFEDTQGTGAGAVSAYQSLLAKGAKVILTDTTSNTVSVAPIATETKTATLSFVTTSPVAHNISPYVFRVSPMNLEGLRLTAGHALAKGYKKIAIVTEQNNYPVSLSESFSKEYEKKGGKVVFSEQFVVDNDLRTMLAKAEQTKPDAILVSVIAPRTGLAVMRAIRDLDIQTPVYGTESMGASVTLRIAQPSELEGIVYGAPLPDEKRLSELRTRYLERWEDDTYDWLYVASAYDATILALDAASQNEVDPKTYLENLENWEGTSGTITFDEAREPGDTQYSLFAISNGERVQIQ